MFGNKAEKGLGNNAFSGQWIKKGKFGGAKRENAEADITVLVFFPLH